MRLPKRKRRSLSRTRPQRRSSRLPVCHRPPRWRLHRKPAAHSHGRKPARGKGGPAPKVLDFSAAKNKAPAKEETAPRKVRQGTGCGKAQAWPSGQRTRLFPLKSPSSPETKCPKVRKLPARRLPFPRSGGAVQRSQSSRTGAARRSP